MQKLRKILTSKRAKLTGGLVGAMFMALALLAPVGLSLQSGQLVATNQVVYATCPEVPADCTAEDVIGTSIDDTRDQALAIAVIAVPALVGAAIIFALSFRFVKMGFRWVLKYIH